MLKRKYIYLFIAFLIVVGISVIYIFNQNKLRQENNYSSFKNDLNNLTDSVVKFHDLHLYQICSYGEDYKVSTANSGSYYVNFDKRKFTETGGVLGGGGEVDENKFLAKIGASKEQLIAYMELLRKHKYFSCIEEDINLKYGKSYAVKFLLGPYAQEKKGYVYISDGSIENDVNTGYLSETFKVIKRIDYSNWFEFEYKK
jgi:hypothetical protein